MRPSHSDTTIITLASVVISFAFVVTGMLSNSSRRLLFVQGTIHPQRRSMMSSAGTTSNFATSLWDGSDKENYSSLNHPGYSIKSDSENYTGGWHSHREVWTTSSSSAASADDKDKDENSSSCWVKEIIKDVTKSDYASMDIGRPPKILVLYGSLRPESFSKKCAYEFARILDLLGCDVRVYNPKGLPVRDPALENEPKVVELRALTQWSDGKFIVKSNQISKSNQSINQLTRLR